MENTSNNLVTIKDRDLHYYRQRMKNRVFINLVSFFREESQRTGVTKKDIAAILKRDPAQISRWFSSPTNMTLESISDILLALGAEADPPHIVRFEDKAKTRPNYAHPLIEAVARRQALVTPQRGRNQVRFVVTPPVSTPPVKADVSSQSSNTTPQNTFEFEVSA